MHPAIVLVGLHKIIHVPGLRVLAQQLVIKRCARGFHRAQGTAFDLLGEQPLADQPIGVLRALLQRVLLDQRTEYVRQRFVQRPGLVEVHQLGLVLGDTMGQLMPDHVKGHREAVEQLRVSIAKHHLGRVPEGIVVVLAKMHGRVQCHAGVVDGVAIKDLVKKIERGAQAVIGLVHCGITAGGLPFATDQRAWQAIGAVGAVDRSALACAHGQGHLRRAFGGHGDQAQRAERAVFGARAQRDLPLRFVAVARDLVEHIGRYQAENRVTVMAITHWLAPCWRVVNVRVTV
ncbi:hypothetical protein PS682_05665 [Pseudomonas fluorescens]|nr:hypothetical protein PS682_05665 [Pseudomonas fluorescens]